MPMTIGVLRWPAFYMDASIVLKETNTIGPAAWHGYLPWYGVETGADSVSCVGTQATMDAEIEQAWRAGIDYFAYDFWAPNYADENNAGLYKHLTSPKASLVKFCLVVVGANNATGWSATADEIVELMGNANYQTMGDQPMLYIFGTTKFIADAVTAGTTAAAQITTLRNKAIAAGLSTPYIATCDAADSGVKTGADALGCNGLSQYNIGTAGSGAALTQAQKLTALQALWAAQVAHAIYSVIPCVGLTWDLRARVASGEWCTGSGYSCTATDYYGDPTPAQVVAHYQAAVDFVAANPSFCTTEHIFINGWDEYTEDGALSPHLADGGANLQALAAHLQRQRESPRSLRARGMQLNSR